MKSPALQQQDSVISRTGEIADLLQQEILLGQYRVGERLPSERDLAIRFETSRGTVREAVKKLEQLGIVSIQPGGARVVPVEMATLDVLGALLKLHQPPDPILMDQVVEVFGALMRLSAKSAVEKAGDEQLEEAIAAAQQLLDAGTNDQHSAIRNMAFTFIRISEHLVLQLVMNGMQTQFIEKPWPDRPPALDKKVLTKIIHQLQSGLKHRDSEIVSAEMKKLNTLLRNSVRDAFAGTQIKPQVV